MSGGTGYGITDQGFVSPQMTDLQDDTNNALRAQLGADINTSPASFLGQLSGILSERLYLIWSAMQDVYESQTPDTAFGASLDNVGALRGIPRLAAAPSVANNVKLFGVAGTNIPAGSQFFVQNAPASIFQLGSAVALVAGQDCIQILTFSAVPTAGSYEIAINGQATSLLLFSASIADIQAAIRLLPFCSGCVVTQLSATVIQIAFAGAGTGGKMVQPLALIENNTLAIAGPTPVTVVPSITQAGQNQANVTLTATVNGPTVANAGTLNQILTPISGMTAVLNTEDAAIGRFVETDNAYRARMNTELQIAGAGTVEAIRENLLTVTGVTSALVYENVEDIDDLAGRPPKSFEAVVEGGSDDDVANMIWKVKPAGIETYGSDTVTITDSQGQTHDIHFSRPTVVQIYMIVNVTIDALLYPSNGDALVKEELAAYVNGLGQGVDIIVIPKLIANLANIPGIDDAVILIGTAPGPTLPDNIIIQPFQVAQTNTTQIAVNHV